MKPLPKNPDRRKTYYKITNKEENHYGLQYHDGLVEDFRTFNDNPESSCVEGGIYFTTSEYILDFFNYGTWIRPLKIPKDAKVILDPEGDKYRADKVFMYKRIPKSQYIRKVFNPNEFNWEKDSVILTTYPKYFDIWWDAERFNWEAGSMYLVKICNSHFKKWWDAEKFNWKVSHLLANYCNEYFDIWWDDERFNWNEKFNKINSHDTV